MAITYHTTNKITGTGNYHFKVIPGERYAVGVTGTWDGASVLVEWQDSSNESLATYPDLDGAPNPITTNGGMEVVALGDCLSITVSVAGTHTDLVVRIARAS